MEKIKNQIGTLACKAAANAAYYKNKAKEKMCEENGDTNFLSIIIILAIVLVVAGVFIIFKDQILGFFTTTWEKFRDTFTDSEQDPSKIIITAASGE